MKRNSIIRGDCIEVLGRLKKPIADLIFADPPFNIGYKYDVYEDRRKYDEYYAWTEKWMTVCAEKALKPAGSFWVAIGDEYAAEVVTIARKAIEFELRNWVVWHYTFGQNTKAKFARSHTHLLYFTRPKAKIVFNREAVMVLSDRQKEYKDKRGMDFLGKVPDDVWTEFPRVCGTFGERQEWHPCQMPESLLARIIRACTKVGQTVLDPFAGSGTTLVVAKKLGRQFVGIELSNRYVKRIKQRLARATAGDDVSGERRRRWAPVHRQELGSLYVENGIGSDRLRDNPHLWLKFVQQFNKRLEALGIIDGYHPDEAWRELERMRKAGKLGRIRVHHPADTKGHYPAPKVTDRGG